MSIKIRGYQKAWMTALGTTLSAVAACLATVQVATGDGNIDVGDVSSIAGAVAVMVSTVYAVWRIPNQDNSTKQTVSDVTLDGN